MSLTIELQAFNRVVASSVMTRLATTSTGDQIDGNSLNPVLSSDGRYLFFESNANHLVEGDNNTKTDIFRKDLSTGEVIRVSTSSSGGEGDGNSMMPRVSPDGRYVAFLSFGTNLVADDTNNAQEIFLKDLETGKLTRISTDGNRREANGPSWGPSFSPDGRYVVFESSASNLVPGDPGGGNNIFIKDLFTGGIARVSLPESGQEPSPNVSYNPHFSADGRYVIFESNATNLSPDDSDFRNDIFLKNIATGEVTLVSTNSDGQKANNESLETNISANGRYVVFASYADNLVDGDTNGQYDVFRKDLVTGETVRVSTSSSGVEGNSYSREPQISADGRYVVFLSTATNLIAGDTNGVWDVFRKDMVTGELIRLSTAVDGTQSDQWSGWGVHLSADGNTVIFGSGGNFVPEDTNGTIDIYKVDAALMAHAPAITDGRYVELTLRVGNASAVSLAWGDGSVDTLTPAGGNANFSHDYGATGTKTAVVTVTENGQSWAVPYTVDLAKGEMVRDLLLADTLSGAVGAEALEGDSSADVIFGNAGNDTIRGVAGNDRLSGGLGKDTLYGGSGQDTFVFDSVLGGGNVDRLRDFSVRDDTIWLDHTIFTKLGSGSAEAPTLLDGSYFRIGDRARDANDFIIYNKSTGDLFYDADGSGRGAMVKFAKIAAGLKLSKYDLYVV